MALFGMGLFFINMDGIYYVLIHRLGRGRDMIKGVVMGLGNGVVMGVVRGLVRVVV